MRPTFDIVAEIIALTCEVPRERITPDSNFVNDVGIDSHLTSQGAAYVLRMATRTLTSDQWLLNMLNAESGMTASLW